MDNKLSLLRSNIVLGFLIIIIGHVSSTHAMNGTIFPLHPYDDAMVLKDAEDFHHALHKAHLDSNTIMNIVANRTYEQRHSIALAYEKKFEKSIISDIRSETKGPYQGLLVGLYKSIPKYYADDLSNGMEHEDDYTLIQVLTVASKSAEMVKNVTTEFMNTHGENLYDAIGKTKFKDNFKKALQKILTNERKPDVPKIDPNQVTDLVIKLNSDLQKINEDDQVLDNVLTTLICTPFNELKEVTVQYKKTYQKDLHEDLDDKLKGSLGELYKELALIANDENTYFAKLYEFSVKGPGTKESIISRLTVCLSEYNLKDVMTAFQNLYNYPLGARLDDDLSGHYQDLIMGLLRQNYTDSSDWNSGRSGRRGRARANRG